MQIRHDLLQCLITGAGIALFLSGHEFAALIFLPICSIWLGRRFRKNFPKPLPAFLPRQNAIRYSLAVLFNICILVTLLLFAVHKNVAVIWVAFGFCVVWAAVSLMQAREMIYRKGIYSGGE